MASGKNNPSTTKASIAATTLVTKAFTADARIAYSALTEPWEECSFGEADRLTNYYFAHTFTILSLGSAAFI